MCLEPPSNRVFGGEQDVPVVYGVKGESQTRLRIKVYEKDLVASRCQFCAQVRGQGRFAHAALDVHHGYDLHGPLHRSWPPSPMWWYRNPVDTHGWTETLTRLDNFPPSNYPWIPRQ